MSGQDALATKVSLPAKLIFILLAGSLSMFCAEVLSGSSVLWFVTPWAWLVTFWLYLAHFLLFINLAFIFRRTSLTALYLWGVLFGLYEAWITKVTWAGYAGSAPGWGTVLGFAFPEFPLIVFLWHPVFSFILPVLCFEALTGKDRILPGHMAVLTKTRKSWALALIVILIGGCILAFNSHGNVAAVVITIAGSVAISGILYLIASRRYPGSFSLESLRLGKIGLAILILYLALLYVLTFVFLLPERTASLPTMILTLGVYGVILLLLYLKKPDVTTTGEIRPEQRLFGLKDIAVLLAILTALGIVFCAVFPVTTIVVLFLYLGMVAASPALFLMAIGNVWTGRRKPGGPNRSP